MTLPGPEILNEDARTPSGPRLRLATVFAVGDTEFGPTSPVALRSMRDLRKYFGQRTAQAAAVHDWLEEHWRQGGGLVYLQRRVGPAPVKASHDFMDGQGTPVLSFTLRMKQAGEFGNEFAGDIDVDGSDFSVKLYRNGQLLEETGLVATNAEAQAWFAANSQWAELVLGAGNDPVATASPADLTGGTDDLDNVTDTETGAAINAHPPEAGPGAYVLLGITSSSAQLLAAARAAETKRLARCDLPSSTSAATLASQAATLRASAYSDYIDIIGTHLTVPGLTQSTTRTVQGSALRCACEAVNDKAGISPNQPAAGRWGAARKAGTVPVVEFTAEDRETLNDAGVNVIRTVDGETRLYGARTAVDPATNGVALRLGSARLRMAVCEVARYEAEQTEFAEIDQGGVVLGDLEGRIRAGLSPYERSFYDLQVDAELVEDDLQPGQYLVEIVIEFQAAPDAERVRVIVTRRLTEV